MAETSQQNKGSGTASVPPQRSGFEELESAFPPLQEDFLKFPEQEPPTPDTGIPPALYQARETDLALASNRSTPVPRPVDREQMIPTANYLQRSQPPAQPPNPEGMKPNASPSLALLPPIQNPRPEESSGPMDLIPEEQELTSLINMFNDQFDMFVRAREAQNTSTMRRLLSQASMTQEMITDLVGRDEAIRLCQEWIPGEELYSLDTSLAHQNYGRDPQNPTETIIRPPSQLALVPHVHHHPMTATPTPEPTGLQHQVTSQEFQGPTPSNQPEFCPQPRQPPRLENTPYRGHQMQQPPPPPPSQPPPQARQRPATIPQEVVQLFRHHPYQQHGGHNQQHQRPYPPTAQDYANQNRPYPQGSWRGSERSGRRPRDDTQRVLQIGEYLMRATRGVRRNRVRGRARGRGQL